jgi:hypothetical protein
MGVLENAKEVADLIKKVGDIELYRKIVALEGEILDLTREKRQAEQKAEELERILSLKKELVFEEPFYWFTGDKTPFCAACWDSKSATVHLKHVPGGLDTRWDCPVCKQTFVVNAHSRAARNSARM